MQVEIREVHVDQRTRWGVVQKRFGLDSVYVNGEYAGMLPNDNPRWNTTFHPDIKFPRELLPEVIANSGGRMTTSLRMRIEDEQSQGVAGPADTDRGDDHDSGAEPAPEGS